MVAGSSAGFSASAGFSSVSSFSSSTDALAGGSLVSVSGAGADPPRHPHMRANIDFFSAVSSGLSSSFFASGVSTSLAAGWACSSLGVSSVVGAGVVSVAVSIATRHWGVRTRSDRCFQFANVCIDSLPSVIVNVVYRLPVSK
jgi:hypothetical protein